MPTVIYFQILSFILLLLAAACYFLGKDWRVVSGFIFAFVVVVVFLGLNSSPDIKEVNAKINDMQFSLKKYEQEVHSIRESLGSALKQVRQESLTRTKEAIHLSGPDDHGTKSVGDSRFLPPRPPSPAKIK